MKRIINLAVIFFLVGCGHQISSGSATSFGLLLSLVGLIVSFVACCDC